MNTTSHIGSVVRILIAGVLLSPQTPASAADPDNDDGFVSIFDGRTLTGWRCLPEENLSDWSVRDGELVGAGSENMLVYLVYKDEQLADFELKLQYRMATRGNSGVEIRARVDASGKRPLEGYHADFGDVSHGPGVLGAWDFHFARREEYACPRGTYLVIEEDGQTHRAEIDGALSVADLHKHDWNQLHIIARGPHMRFTINGKPASEFTDNKPERLKRGMIGLQIHEAGMVVEFKDIWLKKIDEEVGSAERAQLQQRVARLEQQLDELRGQLRNDAFVDELHGLWKEHSYVEGGNVRREEDGVDWRLESDVNSDRIVLSPEPLAATLGKMTIDATKSPVWIDFHYDWLGRSNILRGIVKLDYKQATIALPRREFDGQGFDNPPRPESFQSTADNGVIVYRLVRPDYAKTGR